MFCDSCHWYTAGEKICPHCGAEQKPREDNDVFSRPASLSVIDFTAIDLPAASAPEPAPVPPPPPKPASAPKPALASPPAPAPQSRPAPPPQPRPVQAPAQRPIQIPPPRPAPQFVSPLLKPAPTTVNNKQGGKVLIIALLAIVSLMVIVLLISQTAQESMYQPDYPDYNDSYNDYEYITEPPLEDAQAGESIYFGDMPWTVLEVIPGESILLLRDYTEYLPPGEVSNSLSNYEVIEGYIHLAGAVFTLQDFSRILSAENGAILFQLTPEELEAYGVAPEEDYSDEEYVAVRPVMRVALHTEIVDY